MSELCSLCGTEILDMEQVRIHYYNVHKKSILNSSAEFEDELQAERERDREIDSHLTQAPQSKIKRS